MAIFYVLLALSALLAFENTNSPSLTNRFLVSVQSQNVQDHHG
jgi:hypothetical protein